MKKLYAILIIAAFTFLHTRGLEAGARVQNALTGLKILLIVGLVARRLRRRQGHLRPPRRRGALPLRLRRPQDHGPVPDVDHVRLQRLERLGLRRLRGPRPARATCPARSSSGRPSSRSSTSALNLFYVYAIPPAQMEGVISVAGLAAGNLFGPSAETVLSLLISFALFSSLSAYLILGPRVYYSMARDGIFFKSIAYVDPKCCRPDPVDRPAGRHRRGHGLLRARSISS
ncbi:MAG: APC family permease [Sphingobacterium sp.]|nr:APC family permease [Sphingobacterium sp.]